MSQLIERRAAPSLLGQRGSAPGGTASRHAGSALLDLMHEGFYMLFMLKHGSAPGDEQSFMDRITAFLDDFEREAKKIRADGDDIEAAKYAFCAAVDEIILASPFALRKQWERRPLQLLIFGDQLAGEHFFDRLDALRGKGAMRVQALQVFHMCLLLGFQGKYAIDGGEKLSYLTARLGDEIARMRGKSRGFAPHADRPDQVSNRLRSDLSLWVLTTVFAVAGLGAYLGFRGTLAHDTRTTLAAYNDLVKLPPRAANVTITLP